MKFKVLGEQGQCPPLPPRSLESPGQAFLQASQANRDQPGLILFSPNVQAHWRGHRQKKMYLERLQYLKANVDAVIKVAGMLREVPVSLERSPENSLSVLSPTCGLGRWPKCPGSEGSVSLSPDSGLGPDVGSSEAIPEASGLLPEERECRPPHPVPIPSRYPGNQGKGGQ